MTNKPKKKTRQIRTDQTDKDPAGEIYDVLAAAIEGLPDHLQANERFVARVILALVNLLVRIARMANAERDRVVDLVRETWDGHVENEVKKATKDPAGLPN